MVNHQILFWDTDSRSRVGLSKNKRALIRKIIASYLLGGKLLIRPSELFESESFYFNESVNENGYFYNLMKNDLANLAMDNNMTLEERAKWRFRNGFVFDRGMKITNIVEIEKIRTRTFNRAEALDRAGWKNNKHFVYSSKDVYEKKLNLRFKGALFTIVNNLGNYKHQLDSSMFDYLHSDRFVSSRADLFPYIQNLWGQNLPLNLQDTFRRTCKEALTFATIINTTENYCNRVSDLSNLNVLNFCINSQFYKKTHVAIETIILNSFIQELSNKMEQLDKEKVNFINSFQLMNAKNFVENTKYLITDKDRDELNELLYGRSDHLDGESLGSHFVSHWEQYKNHHKKINRLVSIRIDELKRMNNIKTLYSPFIINILRKILIQSFLTIVGLGDPFSSSIMDSLMSKEDSIKENKMFVGFIKEI